MSFHNLRHPHATNLKRVGENPKVVRDSYGAVCSLCAIYKNTGEIGFLLNNRKKAQTLDTHGLKPSRKV